MTRVYVLQVEARLLAKIKLHNQESQKVVGVLSHNQSCQESQVKVMHRIQMRVDSTTLRKNQQEFHSNHPMVDLYKEKAKFQKWVELEGIMIVLCQEEKFFKIKWVQNSHSCNKSRSKMRTTIRKMIHLMMIWTKNLQIWESIQSSWRTFQVCKHQTLWDIELKLWEYILKLSLEMNNFQLFINNLPICRMTMRTMMTRLKIF